MNGGAGSPNAPLGLRSGTEVAWATDIHLDHVDRVAPGRAFAHALEASWKAAGADPVALILSGDIAHSSVVERYLGELADALSVPVLFVLGNHDYYGASFALVDQRVQTLAAGRTDLHFLDAGAVWLDEAVAVVGVGGFYDAAYGDRGTTLQLTDFRLIEDLFSAQDESREGLLAACARRAGEQAQLLRVELERAAHAGAQSIVVVTHVPPFPGAAWHRGVSADATYAPFFSSKATGDALVAFGKRFPKVPLTVLCGHGHGSGTLVVDDKLVVHTGRARYGSPELAGRLWLDGSILRVEVYPDVLAQ